MEKVVNFSHTQRDAKGECTFEIFNGHYLHVYLANGDDKKDFAIDLIFLKPESAMKRHFVKHWFAGALIGLVVFGAFSYLIKTDFVAGLATYGVAVAAASLVVTVGCLVMFFRTMQRHIVFYSRCASVPLLKIAVSKADSKGVEALVKELQSRISRQTRKVEVSDQQLRAGELRALRRLVNRRIVTQKQYNDAKAIFGLA